MGWNTRKQDLVGTSGSSTYVVLSKDLFYILTIECVGFDGSFDGDWVNCNGFPDNLTCTNAKDCCKHTPMLHSCFNISKLKGKYIIRRAIKWFLQSLSKCTLETFENPDVLIRVLPLPQLLKAAGGFSYLFNAYFDKLCENQSIFCVAQHLPILYQHFSSH